MHPHNFLDCKPPSLDILNLCNIVVGLELKIRLQTLICQILTLRVDLDDAASINLLSKNENKIHITQIINPIKLLQNI